MSAPGQAPIDKKIDDATERVAINRATEYEQICENDRSITEFRGKLLTLLPLASGTGISLLLTKPGETLSSHLGAIGLFGFLVTVGLFFHEYRGILHCGELIKRGTELEKEMGLEKGQYTLEDEYFHKAKGRHKITHWLIGPMGAAWTIYPVVGFAWLYVAASRFFQR